MFSWLLGCRQQLIDLPGSTPVHACGHVASGRGVAVVVVGRDETIYAFCERCRGGSGPVEEAHTTLEALAANDLELLGLGPIRSARAFLRGGPLGWRFVDLNQEDLP